MLNELSSIMLRNQMATYIPPRNFNAVLNNIYRSSIPTDLNHPFLERLHLKTIVYLSSLPITESLYIFISIVILLETPSVKI